MNVSLVAGSDPQLLELLRACGARVTTISVDALAELAMSSSRQPDLLVLDQRGRGSLPAALAAVKRQHATTGILMVLSSLDPSLMLEAMRAGVNECVVEPFALSDLQAAIRRIASQRPATRKGEVFAIIGAKGGVGATTVAVNLATMLTKLQPASTILVDLHLTYGDAGIFLGAEPRFSVLDALENMHRLDPSFLKGLVTSTRSGVQLLASSDRPATAGADLQKIRDIIELTASLYAYVVLDVPRTDTAVLDALEPAGAIVVVANQELATVRSAARMASSLQQRYGRERVNVVMTRYDDDAEIGQRDVERVVGRPVRHVFPNNYPIALASLNKGRPLVLDNHSKLAGSFTTFARAMAGLPDRDKDKSSGLFGRLGGRRG